MSTPIRILCERADDLAISALVPHKKNPNKHSEEQIERLAALIRYHGFRHPIIVSKRSGFIVAGHGRLEAARRLGMAKVPVDYQEFESDEAEYAFLVADNSIALWAELDLAAINLEVPNLGPDFDIDMLGLKDFAIDVAEKSDEDPDAVPEPPKEAKTKRGELWLLGEHRVLCGDATDKADVERLMAGEKADMVFTDPPYGMRLDTEYEREDWGNRPNNHSGGNQGNSYARVKGDHDDFSPALIEAVFAHFPDCPEVFIWGADYFAEHIPGRIEGSWVVWDKVTNRHGEESECAKFHGSNFELCWSKARHKRELARVMHKGLASVEKDRRVHPTQKPVQLAEWFFDRWGKDARIVWDGYLGSGSTLIACEKTGRRCFGTELEPLYVDVILARWAKYTGKDPISEDGRKWSEVNRGA